MSLGGSGCGSVGKAVASNTRGHGPFCPLDVNVNSLKTSNHSSKAVASDRWKKL